MKKSYIKYHIATLAILIPTLTIAILLEVTTAVGGVFLMLLAFSFLAERQHKLRDIKMADNHPDYEENNRKYIELGNQVTQFCNSSFTLGMKPTVCRTCQAEYELSALEDKRYYMCSNLQEHYPHCIDDPPPTPNPYEYYWWQLHGYPPPTVFEPLSIFNNETEKRLQIGKNYYSTHRNVVWDLGIQEAPDWYVQTQLNKIS